jgi:hypothetical protein
MAREQSHTEHMAARHAAGDMRAAYELACHLRDGEGIDADPLEALRWMARAAGVASPATHPRPHRPTACPRPCASWRRCCAGTRRASASPMRSRRAVTVVVAVPLRTAARTMPATQAQLGFALYEGLGGERDLEGGVRHYEVAAERNNAMALFNLGIAHKLGEPGDPDLVRAIGYFRRAEEAGDADATLQIGSTLRQHALALAEQGHARPK